MGAYEVRNWIKIRAAVHRVTYRILKCQSLVTFVFSVDRSFSCLARMEAKVTSQESTII